jgi:hypothetical protein
MSNDLYRIVYFSRNRIGGSPEEIDRAVQDILSVARRKNAQLGFTGALMFNSGCFLQILEGRHAPLLELFERIKRDERHSAVSMLTIEPIAERAFGNWSMAFVGTKESDLAQHGAIAEESGFDPSRMSSDAVSSFLHKLVLREEQQRDSQSQSAFG